MLSYVLPTRNRPERLRRTLDALNELGAEPHARIGGAEIVIVDNASDVVAEEALADSQPSSLPHRVIRLNQNIGAAARNVGAQHAQGDWLVMLDDDSHPLDCGHIDVLLSAPNDAAAIGADIVLPDGSRERGGLPEVIIGCGAAIRRDAFLAAGGYDPSFDYYAEEYDLCAKLILAGWRIVQDDRFRVLHEKTTAGRNFNHIAHRLVRNNAWVMQRYAPEQVRASGIAHTIERYAQIAMNEAAARGFATGMTELLPSLSHQPRQAMSASHWQRFTGEAAAKNALNWVKPSTRVAIVEAGKNVEIVCRVLGGLGAEIVSDPAAAEVRVIGTLSPGPMRDAWQKWGGRATMCA